MSVGLIPGGKGASGCVDGARAPVGARGAACSVSASRASACRVWHAVISASAFGYAWATPSTGSGRVFREAQRSRDTWLSFRRCVLFCAKPFFRPRSVPKNSAGAVGRHAPHGGGRVSGGARSASPFFPYTAGRMRPAQEWKRGAASGSTVAPTLTGQGSDHRAAKGVVQGSVWPFPAGFPVPPLLCSVQRAWTRARGSGGAAGLRVRAPAGPHNRAR